jgi:hypothetical protein
MRSTKVPTKRGHGFSVKTVNEDVSSKDKFSVARGDKVGSAGTDADLDDEAAGAALRTRPNGVAAWVEDCTIVVCWQKPPGCTRICQRRCRFFTGRCNERQRSSDTQEANGWVAAPPSLNGLVRLLYERNPKCVKRPEGHRMMAQLLHRDRH